MKLTFTRKWPLLLTLMFTLYACSPIQVLDQEPAESFSLSNYRTFDFYEIDASGDSVNSRMYRAGIAALKTEITQQLQKRGLQPGDHEPDLLVNIGIAIKADAPRYIVQKRYPVESEEGVKYTEGTVTVHLVERVNNRLVWRGAVEGVVPARTASLQRNVADAMEALFKGI
jgi:hypothetical protein